MFESLKVANVLHKHTKQNPSAAWVEHKFMPRQENLLTKYGRGSRELQQ